ncbi:MAG: isoprenylcysteine carboxylmethyltransferase family protein [Dehalococcoidia bacterium]|nr:isoprenylcysteine carboxylmethyltransferase family protein [Dehalococcoidia bacterium]
MTIDEVSKIVLITLFSAFSVIRIMYYVKTRRAGYRTVIEERRRYSIWLSIFICYEVFTFFLFIWFPQMLAWASLPLPAWSRLLGSLLGLVALLWFVWIHRSLGSSHSASLRIKDRQVLVTDGPYSRIRHPMYSAFYLLHAAVFFLTANWFMGVTWLAGLSLVILLRVRREEEMLLERFGEEYGSYMQRTGRFIPPMRSLSLRAGRTRSETGP